MKTTATGQSIFLLLDLIELFKEKNINYGIIGAFAASYYGSVRASLDIDAIIFLQQSSSTIKSLLNDFQDRGYSVQYHEPDFEDPLKGLIAVSDSYSNKVDLILGIKGLDDSFIKRTVSAAFNNQTINICSLEDFISMKIFAGSAKDLEDIQNVLKVSAEELNMELLKKLTANYGQKELEILNKILQKQQ